MPGLVFVALGCVLPWAHAVVSIGSHDHGRNSVAPSQSLLVIDAATETHWEFPGEAPVHRQTSRASLMRRDGSQAALLAHDDPEECKACQSSQHMTLAVPFYEEDICMLKLMARSVNLFDAGHVFERVLLMWASPRRLSDFEEPIRAIHAAFGRQRPVTIVDYSNLTSHLSAVTYKKGEALSQQISTLSIARYVKTAHYLVLHVHNVFVSPVQPSHYFDGCHRARLYCKRNQATASEFPGAGRLDASIRVLTGSSNQSFVEGMVIPGSSAPFIFHTQSVLDLMSFLYSDRGVSVTEAAIQGSTEFLLYSLFMLQKGGGVGSDGQRRCVSYDSAVEGLDHMMIRPEDCGEKLECMRNMASRPGHLSFGVHDASFQNLTERSKLELSQAVFELYKNAGLLETGDSLAGPASLLRCMQHQQRAS